MVSRKVALVAFMSAGVLVGLSAPRAAHAKLIAVSAQVHGGAIVGRGAEDTTGTGGAEPGFGAQIGARLLFIEAYLDHTISGKEQSVTRAWLGGRAGLGLFGVSIFGRAGGGALLEKGGVLAGRPEDPMMMTGWDSRRGFMGRLGGGVELDIAPMLRVGLGVEVEYFIVAPTGGSWDDRITGRDVFAELHVKFELGI